MSKRNRNKKSQNRWVAIHRAFEVINGLSYITTQQRYYIVDSDVSEKVDQCSSLLKRSKHVGHTMKRKGPW